jgi:hypothetical protein
VAKKNFFYGVLVGGVILGTLFFYTAHRFIQRQNDEGSTVFQENGGEENLVFDRQEDVLAQEDSPIQEEFPVEEEPVSVIFKDQNVPFVVQAPGGLWENPRYQDGCEEASLLMAFSWVEGKEIESLALDLDTISYAMGERLGTFYDTSIEDTFLFAYEYLEGENVFLKKDVTKDDIIRELMEGYIVAITVNGQKLENQYFTSPGPLYHMIILRGYDPETEEFIANDPGTQYGKGYRYQEDLLFSAMHNYETGKKSTIYPDEKSMIVFQREGESI